MEGLVTLAVVGGVLAAITLIFGKKEASGVHSPTSGEFKDFVEQRTKEFLSGQDLDSFVRLVPEEKRAGPLAARTVLSAGFFEANSQSCTYPLHLNR